MVLNIRHGVFLVSNAEFYVWGVWGILSMGTGTTHTTQILLLHLQRDKWAFSTNVAYKAGFVIQFQQVCVVAFTDLCMLRKKYYKRNTSV